MRKRKIALFASALLLASVACAQNPPAPNPPLEIGGKLPSISLSTVTGETVNLSQYFAKKGILVMFVSTRCPVSNDYEQRMMAVAAAASARGFAFVGINSNRNEPADEVVQHSKEKGLNLLILKDPDNRLADQLGASFTPEAFLFDESGTLRYHGRIDDSRDVSKVTTRDLEAAIEALAAGRAVSVTQTKAFGCTIKRVPRGDSGKAGL